MSKAIFSGGEWLDGDGEILETISPLNDVSCWQGNRADHNQILTVVEKAKACSLKWAALSLQTRLAYIESFGQQLEHHTETLALRISKEIGKPFWEAKQEVQSMIQKISASIAAYDDRCPIRERAIGQSKSITRHRPHGVVVVLGPYNFPGHIPNGHIVPALIAGNVVILKPSDKAPFVSELMVSLWEKSGLPSGVLSLIQGGVESARSLIDHPDVRAVFFTGSSTVGFDIQKRCHGSGKLLALEMGGNNPLIVSSFSDLKAVVLLILQSAFLSAGQRCTCARRLIVVDNDHTKDLIPALVKAMTCLKIGDGEDVFMGPVISEVSARRVLLLFQTYTQHGAIVLKQMEHLGGAFLTPGLLDVSMIPVLQDEECFGPMLLYKKVRTFEDALEEANATRFGLSASVVTTDQMEFQQAFQAMRVGILNWNSPTTGASGLTPFGGIGLSGNYHPSAYYAADYCSYPVASMEQDRVSLPQALPPGVFL